VNITLTQFFGLCQTFGSVQPNCVVARHCKGHSRTLSRRIPPPPRPPAGTLPRGRRRKKLGAPPRQPKFTEAAAAAIFAARRGASDSN